MQRKYRERIMQNQDKEHVSPKLACRELACQRAVFPQRQSPNGRDVLLHVPNFRGRRRRGAAACRSGHPAWRFRLESYRDGLGARALRHPALRRRLS
jgi:hypothetical protein